LELKKSFNNSILMYYKKYIKDLHLHITVEFT